MHIVRHKYIGKIDCGVGVGAGEPGDIRVTRSAFRRRSDRAGRDTEPFDPIGAPTGTVERGETGELERDGWSRVVRSGIDREGT
ncbi:hypothetical protein DV707_00170 [Halobellus limi]|nr:hypothetical protein DV707_00170 [Halobellus limi]